MANFKKVRRHRFYESGVCLPDWPKRNPDVIAELLHDVMRKNGYAPILGTERVKFTKRDDGNLDFKVSISGGFLGDNLHKVQYLTTEGVVVWNRTPNRK